MPPASPPPLADADVVDAGRGDPRAISALVRELQPRVEEYARARMASRLERSIGVEDIAQETLTAALASMGAAGVSERAGLERYALSIAERRIRHAGRKREATPLDELAPPETMADGETGPCDQLLASEHRREVRRALAQLPEEYRRVVILRDYLGISWDVSRLALDRPTAHAAQCLYVRARRALGRRLEVSQAP